MKTYTKSWPKVGLHRRCWYDPHFRMWTLQHIDNDGNQMGEVEYVPKRVQAMSWLWTGETK